MLRQQSSETQLTQNKYILVLKNKKIPQAFNFLHEDHPTSKLLRF